MLPQHTGSHVSCLYDGLATLDTKLKLMKENVEHHVEEEENQMFPQVLQIFDAAELEQLGQELNAAKQE